MKQIKVDILVTCYNQKEQIIKTIDSLINQKTTLDYQIIISDDCSTDGSYELLKKYIKNYQNIKLIQPQEKKCVGNNRNNLIEHIDNDYVIFVDGDDPQPLTFLETIYQEIKKEEKDIYLLKEFVEIWSDKEVIKEAINYDNFMFKVYKKEILKNLKVNPDIQIGEDVEFAMRNYQQLMNNYKVINARYYLNRLDDNISLTKNQDFLKRFNNEKILYHLIKEYDGNVKLKQKINNKRVELIQLAYLANEKYIPEEKIEFKYLGKKFKLSYLIYKITLFLNVEILYKKLLEKKIGHKI